MIALSDLLKPIDQDTARAQLVARLVTLGIPADQWVVGGPLSTILTVIAWVYASFSTLMVAFVSAGFLGYASGGWLTLIAYYVYGVTRPAATFATGTETFTNTGGGLYSFAPGQVTIKSSSTGQLYTNTETLILGAVGSPTASKTVGIVAQSAGTVGNALPGTVDRLVTPMAGVIVGNPVSIVGIDALSDESLRELCMSKLGALGFRGVRGAYFYAIGTATNAVTGGPVNINRSFVSAASHTGIVTVYVASPAGAADVNDVAGVVTSIEQKARPDAVTVNVSSAAAIPYTPTIIVWAYAPSGVTAAAAATAIGTAITGFTQTYPIGGVSAADDDHFSFTGLFSDGVKAAMGAGLTGIGGQLLSTQGVTDLAIVAGQVPAYGGSVTVRIVPQGVATT
jgi:hypothetical protein